METSTPNEISVQSQTSAARDSMKVLLNRSHNIIISLTWDVSSVHLIYAISYDRGECWHLSICYQQCHKESEKEQEIRSWKMVVRNVYNHKKEKRIKLMTNIPIE